MTGISLNNALTANRQAVGGFLRFEEKHNAVYSDVYSWLHFQTKAVDGSQSPIEVFFKTCKSLLNLGSECHSLSYDALTAHVSLVFIWYMLLSLQQRNNSDDRTISELFLLMINELADITFGHALQLIVDIMLQMIQERFGLSVDQLDHFLADFVGRLPVSYQHALRLKAS